MRCKCRSLPSLCAFLGVIAALAQHYAAQHSSAFLLLLCKSAIERRSAVVPVNSSQSTAAPSLSSLSVQKSSISQRDLDLDALLIALPFLYTALTFTFRHFSAWTKRLDDRLSTDKWVPLTRTQVKSELLALMFA